MSFHEESKEKNEKHLPPQLCLLLSLCRTSRGELDALLQTATEENLKMWKYLEDALRRRQDIFERHVQLLNFECMRLGVKPAAQS